MIRFALLTKTGEVINTIAACSVDDACDMFATLKKISNETLLEIFDVEPFVR